MDIKQKNTGKSQTVINNESGIINIDNSKPYTNLAGDEALHVYKEISQVKQGKFSVGFVIACLLPGLSLIADIMQIHPVINLPIWIYLITFILIFFIIIISYYDNLKIFCSSQPSENHCRHLYDDKLFQRTDDGYIIFTYTKNCIYPGCKGNIEISSSPERYNGEYSFFGVCSLAGKQHSYGIDYNFNAYPIDVDWRVIPRSR